MRLLEMSSSITFLEYLTALLLTISFARMNRTVLTLMVVLLGSVLGRDEDHPSVRMKRPVTNVDEGSNPSQRSSAEKAFRANLHSSIRTFS